METCATQGCHLLEWPTYFAKYSVTAASLRQLSYLLTYLNMTAVQPNTFYCPTFPFYEYLFFYKQLIIDFMLVLPTEKMS